MRRQMTTIAAWKYLARRWDAAKKVGDHVFASVKSCRRKGVCNCICVMCLSGMISFETGNEMNASIDLELEGLGVEEGGYLFPLTIAGARKRAAFCRRQAKLLEKKAK